ncbi:single-stranded-DNA-specific exonuclease RecJ [Anaeroselena agilis]|uniref:Single-stranded-DNA-specific exonuclease RecJ n=1 Tax=Anaeroselena agilis TaxID=3063788 RepID=A0ABU3NW31_9FIRM|nr:single-stranded-DNA-specific exonuclease RecJ [Selenomonadales bacterium 4137-cl]
MAKPGKIWRVVPARDELAARLARNLGVSPVVAQVLVNRGISDEAEARLFLRGGRETLPDPFLMLGMEAAVVRIRAAVDAGEKITVYGDYDVDGVTATALLYRVLTRLGGAVDYYIPERQNEGYGLNATALEMLYQSGTRLLVTVDCGISAAAEVAALAGRMDIIVTDHHQPPEVLPPALAVLNPKQRGCPYPEKNLAGVGVAFKLCQGLWRRYKDDEAGLDGYLDLVAVGTVADIVPLTGENRVLVKLGLSQLAVTANVGLRAIMSVAGLPADKMDTGRVGFGIAPRLNAAGRLGHAAAGVELLITDDSARAAELATELDAENSRRQAVEKELLAAAEGVLAGADPAAQKVLVLAGENWHSGVIGIVASRLVDRYYRPVVMISVRDGIGKGSCRSIPGFDIYRALEQCADLLVQFGGHQFAAGLTIEAANIDALRDRLSDIAAATLTAADYQPVLDIDACVALSEIDAAFLQQLAALAPHGTGNPSPVFVCEELAVTEVRPVGQEGRHLKLRVRRERVNGDVIGWDLGGLAARLDGDATIDLAFVPEFNEWRGQRTIQLKANDVRVRPTAPEQVRLIDARGEDKEAYLAKVLPDSLKTLVVVNDRREAVLLARRLSRLSAAVAGVGCWHPAMGAGREGRLRRRFAAGGLQVLVAAGDYGGEDDGIADIIFYKPPLTKAVLGAYCRLAAAQSGPVGLHFAYGAADRRDSGALVEELFPDRKQVGWVYLTLRETAGPDGRVSLPPRLLGRAVAARSGRVASPAGVEACVAVLAEIGLARYDGTNAGKIVMSPVPDRKLDLECSAAFRAGVAARREYAAFVARLLGSPLTELWKLATDGE